MGTDKALLPFRGKPLVQWVAECVCEAAGNVTLVGEPERYANLGLPVIADAKRDCGPLGGIVAALACERAEWNLVVACDMPNLTTPVFESLFVQAEAAQADALIPIGPSQIPDPLCAVYRSTCFNPARQALEEGRLKVVQALAHCRIEYLKVTDGRWLVNTNTPQEWNAIQAAGVVLD